MIALLLNSGLGSRMGDETREHPKCMTPISPEHTIISWQVKLLKDCGITEAVVTTGPFAEQLQAEAADSVLMVFVDVPKWVALVCMLAGGIGVTNILLVSVRERRREIGIMQSLGATRIQICGLFLCEALIYALTGGILGLLRQKLYISLSVGVVESET